MDTQPRGLLVGLGYPHLSSHLEDTLRLAWLTTSQLWPQGEAPEAFPYKDNNSAVMKLLGCPTGWAGEGK